MIMATSQWLAAKRAFQSCLELPDDQRSDWLIVNCRDPQLRDEVQRLLSLDRDCGEFLESPIRGIAIEPADRDPWSGKQLGGFELIRRIGVGGMGVVYEARQLQPERRAAIKVLRLDLVSPTLLQRLREEAGLLARLQHPGIAQVYAAGEADLGLGLQPWFAMELVEGQTLHQFLMNCRLSLVERLQLFLRIAEAVEHAHQRGILHRDLKPENIQVVTQTGCGLPAVKVLDFGVARMMGGSENSSRVTMAGDVIGTVGYMSPEQFLGDSQLMAARVDVYALGVIGFELLSGQRPHQRQSSSLAQLMQRSDRHEPKRLSQVLPHCSGDLELIFAKALAVDPEARYQTVKDFSDDLQRYLVHEPIRARSPSVVYRFRKFVRRNQIAVLGVASTILGLGIGLGLYMNAAASAREAARVANAESAKAQYEADKAIAINNFMTNDFLMQVLTAAHTAPGGDRLPVVELVNTAAAKIGSMFAGQPLQEAAIRNEIATVYYNLGEFAAAATEFRTAHDLWLKELGPEHFDTLKTVANQALIAFRLGQHEESERLFLQALEGRRMTLGPNHAQTLMTMNNLAELYRATKRPAEAESLLRETWDKQRSVLGERHKDTLTTMANLASLLAQRGQLDSALALHRQVFQTSADTFGSQHPLTLQAGLALGLTLQKSNQPDEAITVLTQITAGLEATYGPDHLNLVMPRRILARAWRAKGDRSAAQKALLSAEAAAALSQPPQAKLLDAIRQELKDLETPQTESK